MSVADAITQAQSAVVLTALDRWLRGAPDRSVTLSYDLEHGFRVALREQHASTGVTLVDAASQVATTLLMQEGTP